MQCANPKCCLVNDFAEPNQPDGSYICYECASLGLRPNVTKPEPALFSPERAKALAARATAGLDQLVLPPGTCKPIFQPMGPGDYIHVDVRADGTIQRVGMTPGRLASVNSGVVQGPAYELIFFENGSPLDLVRASIRASVTTYGMQQLVVAQVQHVTLGRIHVKLFTMMAPAWEPIRVEVTFR